MPRSASQQREVVRCVPGVGCVWLWSCSTKRNPWGDPGAGPLITLLQFVVVAGCTLPAVTTAEVCVLRGLCVCCMRMWMCVRACVCLRENKRLRLVDLGSDPLAVAPAVGFGQGLVPRFRRLATPLRVYLLQTLLFFCMSVLNNVAFNFRISQPVHVIVRSANLVLTYVVGRLAGERCVCAGCVRMCACVWCLSCWAENIDIVLSVWWVHLPSLPTLCRPGTPSTPCCVFW
jgi:hypothetical protein